MYDAHAALPPCTEVSPHAQGHETETTFDTGTPGNYRIAVHLRKHHQPFRCAEWLS